MWIGNEEGTLNLDDVVACWIPGVSGDDKVRLRQLLEHTAGYPDHYPQTYPAGPRTLPITPDEIIGEWGHHGLLFEPGTRFRYSNFNYVLAGRIIEMASGEPLFALLRRRVFSPLGMHTTVDLDDIGPDTPDVRWAAELKARSRGRAAPCRGVRRSSVPLR